MSPSRAAARSSSPSPTSRLLGDHSHHSTPLLDQLGSASASSSPQLSSSEMTPNRSGQGTQDTVVTVDYTEKELDDALAFLDARDDRTRSNAWFTKFASWLTTRVYPHSSYRFKVPDTPALTNLKPSPRKTAGGVFYVLTQRAKRTSNGSWVLTAFVGVLALAFCALVLLGSDSVEDMSTVSRPGHLKGSNSTAAAWSTAGIDSSAWLDQTDDELEDSVFGRVKQAPKRLKQFGQSMWHSVEDQFRGHAVNEAQELKVIHKGLNLLNILNHDTPQKSIYRQLKDNVRYVTSMAFGGHTNQFIAIQKLLLFAKMTNRVAIIPTLTPLHIDEGQLEHFSTFYDLDRFYDETSVPAVPLGQLKAIDTSESRVHNDQIGCWSVQEACSGYRNADIWGLDMHGIWPTYWPLPNKEIQRGLGGFDLAFDALRLFDFDVWRKKSWIDRVIKERLPQKEPALPSNATDEELLANVKDGFSPNEPVEGQPNDQLMCFDNTLFVGPLLFGKTFEAQDEAPLEPTAPGEATSWLEVGQHIHFNSLVERRVEAYLRHLFEVEPLEDYNEDDLVATAPTTASEEADNFTRLTRRWGGGSTANRRAKVPPFISMHLRRGDFKDFTGFTPLESYKIALERVRERLQVRLDDPEGWSGPTRETFKHHGVPASEYAVVVTTDEAGDSDFVKEVRELGWKVVDHDALTTKDRFGPWWPTIMDAAILSHGESFVGTDRSTFSHLAGLRVKFWQGGVVEVAQK